MNFSKTMGAIIYYQYSSALSTHLRDLQATSSGPFRPLVFVSGQINGRVLAGADAVLMQSQPLGEADVSIVAGRGVEWMTSRCDSD